jgi:type I restriction enzyme R subunit
MIIKSIHKIEFSVGGYSRGEKLDKEQFNNLIESYIYSGREPIKDDVFKCLDNRPSILQARSIGERILDKMKKFVEMFIEGMTG